MTYDRILKILREIASPGSRHLFSRREAARSAADLIERQSARITELEAMLPADPAEMSALLAASAPNPSDKQEAVALPKRGYFVYDPDAGSPDFYDTDAERDAAHREAIKDYRDEALFDGEWSPSVDSIVSGIVTHKTVEIDVCGDNCDYAPAPAAPLAQSAEQEAVGTLRIEDDGYQLTGIATAISTLPDGQYDLVIAPLAQSAEQDRMDAELFQRLLHARSELGRTIADPMWADHGEVTKAALKRWHSTIDEVIKGASK